MRRGHAGNECWHSLPEAILREHGSTFRLFSAIYCGGSIDAVAGAGFRDAGYRMVWGFPLRFRLAGIGAIAGSSHHSLVPDPARGSGAGGEFILPGTPSHRLDRLAAIW